MTTSHTLYRFYDAAGDLLYIGITLAPSDRFKNHSQTKPWWPNVTDIHLERHESRQVALTAERAAIREENPLHNRQYNIVDGEERLTEAQVRIVEQALATPGFYGQIPL